MLKSNEKPFKIWYNLIATKNYSKQKKKGFIMNNYTANTYEIKRGNINFSKKITKDAGKVQSKYVKQMIYGMIKNQSCVLSEIADALDEENKKINTIERLSRQSSDKLDESIHKNYIETIKPYLGATPVILVDDSDIIKPYGKAFESLGVVRDGSSINNKYEKGYHVTEVVALSENEKQPISLYSRIHSSVEKNYSSMNTVTYEGLDTAVKAIGGKGTFVFDRGYDMNNLYKWAYKNNQNFIVRISKRRKIFHKGKWLKSNVLANARKGKIKTVLTFQGEEKEIYVSYLNVKITATKRNIKLLLVYGLGKEPMMIATNCPVLGKEDAVKIVRTYMSRWRIEEYFRFKKQTFGLENIRVRSLQGMNTINNLLTYAIGYIGILAEKIDRSLLTIKIIEQSKALRKDILFYYYQISKGIKYILNHAKRGIKEYLKIEQRPRYIQLSLFKT